MEDLKRTCLNCGEALRGRIDKKFCDDQCRNNYNNAQKATTNNLIRNINNALKKNRSILEAFIPEGENLAKTTKERLTRNGFQFRYLTHTFENKKGNTYHYCYDYGYLELDGDWVLVVRGKES
ncbi:hypothetical protein [Algoriphagus namhaensis]